jgi:hypothetical protein
MIYFKEIELDNYDLILDQCRTYIKSNSKIYNRELVKASAYGISVDGLLQACPELESSFLKYGLRIVTAGAYVMYKPEHTSLHIDLYRTKSRINLPIFNCEGTYLNFYSNAKTILVTNPESGYKNLHVTNPDECVLEASLELKKATVVLISEPHKVILPADNITPRITLTLGFDKDPIYLLGSHSL